MKNGAGRGWSKSEHIQRTQADQLEESTSQAVGEKAVRGTWAGPGLRSIPIPGKGYGAFFHNH